MKQLFPRGKRIHPTDKDLVFHTAFAALFPVCSWSILFMSATSQRTLAGSDPLPNNTGHKYPLPVFSMGVAGLVCPSW